MTQSWSTIEGSIYGNAELSKKARMIAHKQMSLLDIVEPAGEFKLGRKSGDKIGFRLVGRISTLATTPLPETTTVPFGKPPVYHGTSQVNRYAYAVPWTGTRQDLDRIDVEETTIRSLRDHSARTHNKLIYDVLVAGRSYTYVMTNTASSPTHAWLADGTVAGTATRQLQLYDLRKIKYRAKTVNMPPADGKNYFLYGSPLIEDGVNSDVQDQGFVDVSKYAPSGAEGALQGEIGKIQGIRIACDNDVIPDETYGSGFVVGEEACKEVMVYPSHFRANMNLGGDFGNQQGICWQSLLGYKVVWNHTTHGQGSVIHITTA